MVEKKKMQKIKMSLGKNGFIGIHVVGKNMYGKISFVMSPAKRAAGLMTEEEE